MSLSLELPERVLKELKGRAEREDTSMDDIVADAIMMYRDLNDSETKQEVHIRLSHKYLREAEEFLVKGDNVQASEKGWEAATQMIKAAAIRRGIELRSHGELHKFVAQLVTETKDNEIRKLWQSAIALHQNFYENWLPEEIVAGNIEDVKELLKKFNPVTR